MHSDESQNERPTADPTNPAEPKHYARQRAIMVQQQLASRDISSPTVLAAMNAVPRQRFVPERMQSRAYFDGPLPIGYGQTISQPYIVALMSQLAEVGPDANVLDVGTGCGYQAAVLAEMGAQVVSIEIVEALAEEARNRLAELGYRNVQVLHGDGYQGFPSRAPFDAIIVAAAPNHIPQPLIDQLAVGGKLVIPVGDDQQQLTVIEKQSNGSTVERQVAAVSFVPMTGPLRVP